MATEQKSEQAKKKLRRVPMRAVDKAWLEMDSAVNLMIINGVMVFDGELDYEEFKAVVATRFVRRYRLFRQRAIEHDGRMYWEDDPNFDLRAHVRRVALPAPGDRATLQELISSIINEPLDRRRPLWRFFFVENVEGGTAIVGRLHHAMADGIALIGVLFSMTGETAADSLRIVDEPAPPGGNDGAGCWCARSTWPAISSTPRRTSPSSPWPRPCRRWKTRAIRWN